MIRATIGSWVNYATTILFQVLFALRFGTGHAASAYVIAFALVAGLSGLLVSTAQSVVAGRILAEDGSLRTGPLKLTAAVIAAGALMAMALTLLADPAGAGINRLSGYPAEGSSRLVVLAGVALFLQVLGGTVGAIALVRGRRLLPALAPAFPTLVSGGAMVFMPALDVSGVLAMFVIGSCVQCVVVVVAAANNVRLNAGSVPRLAPTTFIVLVSFFLLSLIFPFERVMAGLRAASEVAEFDYAIRSLRAVQQLILGGAMLATLGDWSALSSGRERGELTRSLLSVLVLVTVVLVLAASVGVVASHGIVAIVYQRGHFLASDTDAVSRILLAGLPGFCLEGISLVLTAALAGARANVALALVGLFNVATRVILTVALAPQYGAAGVAAAYSITQLIVLGPVFYLASRHLLAPTFQLRQLQPALVVMGGTLTSALLLATVTTRLPSLISGVTVVAVCALLWWAFQPIKVVRLASR